MDPFAPAAYAETLFVAPNGNNSHPGTRDRPFATITHASTQTQPGDTVVIMAGVYHERVKIKASGTKEHPLTFRGEAGAIIDGSHFPASDYDDRIAMDGLVVVSGQSHIALVGLTARNSKHHGFSINAGNPQGTATHITIKRCRSENTDGAGIIAYGSYPATKYQLSHIRIEDNEVISPQLGRFNGNNRWQEDITVGGGVEHFIISGNHVDAKNSEDWEGGPLGIDAKDGVRHGEISNNHVENIPSQGIYVDGFKFGASHIEIFENRVHAISGYGIIVGAELGGSVDEVKIHHNVVYNTGWSGIIVDRFVHDGVDHIKKKTNLHIFHNTIHNTGKSSPNTGGIDTVVGTSGKIHDNIVDTDKNPLQVEGTYEVERNCVTNDAGFVDADRADFHLQPTSSCRGKGAHPDPVSRDVAPQRVIQ